MARSAKKTDRAEARRQYRAALAESEALAAEAEEAEAEAAAGQPAGKSGSSSSSRSSRPNQTSSAGSTSAGSTGRLGFTAVLRAAARPWNVRSDIAYIPTLVLHTRAVWIPAVATIGSGAFFLLSQPLGSNAIALFLFQLFVVPPTIAGAFLAGVLAPRATYIAGGIAASIGVMVFAFAVLTTPADSLVLQPAPTPSPVASAASAAPSPAGSAAPSPSGDTGVPPAEPIDPVSAIIQSVFISVPFGVLIGAAGGYYRRFLALSGANSRRRDEQRAKARSQSRKK